MAKKRKDLKKKEVMDELGRLKEVDERNAAINEQLAYKDKNQTTLI